MKAIYSTTVFMVFSCLSVWAQPLAPKTFQTSRPELIEFEARLWSALNPKLPENAYFPPLVKERLAWIESQNQQKKLGRYGIWKSEKNLRMYVAMHEWQPGVQIPAIFYLFPDMARIAYLVQGGLTGLKEEIKNDYAVGYTHESIHLELPLPPVNVKDEARTPKTGQQFDDSDEARAWFKTAKLAIHPLVMSKHPLEEDLVRLDKATITCKQIKPCPDFDSWLYRHRVR